MSENRRCKRSAENLERISLVITTKILNPPHVARVQIVRRHLLRHQLHVVADYDRAE